MRSNCEISGNIVNDILGVGELYEKSTKKLFSFNGTQMKIKYELNNAHVCHDNVCFKNPSVLVKNMTAKVILGLPFSFWTESKIQICFKD